MSRPAGFRITNGKGFHVTFDNGFTVSVQFGYGNYCENRYEGDSNEYNQRRLGEQGSATAEVAVWGPDGKFVKLDEYDDVCGYVTPEQVALLLHRVSTIQRTDQLENFDVLLVK